MKNTTVTFKNKKTNGEKITMLTAYDYTTAKLEDEAGVDSILVGDSLGMVIMGYDSTLSVTMDDMIHHSQIVARGAKNALVVTDMPFMSYQTSVYDAVVNAGRLIKEGHADAVKLEGGVKFEEHIRKIVDASIPVVGHIGMTPQSVNAFGGFKVQGKNIDDAKKIIEDAKAVERAGAFAVVLECVPTPLATYITEILSIPTIGIGAGNGCDGQVLVYQDMLGMYSDFTPKFVKKYGELGENMKNCFKEYEVRKTVKAWKKEGLTVGLVPTMGYLHEGHKSLIDRAVKENDRVVVSDFVNPTQFGPNEDFESYPRDINADAKLCESAGASIIFNPEADEMYDNALTFVDMNKITKVLCGKTRPIHFSGVCTVVSKLFNIVQPDRAYFGQKDAQQLCVIKKMVKDLNFDIEIVGCPIIREDDGLAKSSRNTYLNADERKAALCLSRSLEIGKKMIADGETDVKTIISAIKAEIEKEPLAKIDYVEMVDFNQLETLEKVQKPLLCAMAVYIGKTRLIDNFIWEAK